MLGGADNPNGELPSYITGADIGNGDNVGKLLEGEYFTVRGYQKGTVHIVFKRSDLVEKLNDIIARHYPGALPPRV
ncbi:hypothetical protein DE21_20290 [Salmonella enterica subsp. enterica serovar Typhimurium var. 5-]|nr:hypothetical protein DE21_20290 [Salmonella enterica subsp. enterica serovar Typhimurium var. 5-]